jgi:hypothetical protein
MRLKDYSGKQFGRLRVVERGQSRNGHGYWKCLCSCGKSTTVGGGNLVAGKTESCGCLRAEMASKRLKSFERIKLAVGVGSCNFLWNRYMQGARKRGFVFDVSREAFMTLTSADCHYCGSAPSRIVKGPRSNGKYVCNGIDRADSEKGYIDGNMLPCCSVCNYAKNDMEYEDFQAWIDRLVKFRARDLIGRAAA